MQIKHVVLCYIEHNGRPDRWLRKEVEFEEEPTREQIQEVIDGVELFDSDYGIDYSSGAVLSDYRMPRVCKVRSIHAVVEKRFYREVST